MIDEPGIASVLRQLVAGLECEVDRLRQPRRTFRIAGEAVVIHATRRAAAILGCMEPLCVADVASPALDVFVIDAESDRVELPDTAATRRDATPPGGLGAFSADGIRAFYQPDAGVLSVLDEPRRRAWCWCRNAAALPYYEYAAPLRHLLQWWMLARGGALVHSAAVGTAAGGALIVGPSGSGKSTTALACVEAGLGFAGDDYVIVAPGEPLTVHMAYSTLKVVRETLPRHDRYRGHFRNLGRVAEKPMLFMHEVAPRAVVHSFPVRALVLPVVAHRAATRIVRAGAAELLRALAPSSVMLFPLAGPLAFRRMAAWCRTLPCYRAELACDARDVGAAFAAWLSRDVTRTAA